MTKDLRETGLTLVELLATLTTVAVLAGVSVPLFSTFSKNNNLSVASNELVISLNTARSEAVTRGIPVSVCASSDGKRCTGSTDWNSGWIIFTDNSGFSGVLDGGDERLRVHGGTAHNLSIRAAKGFIRFLPSGGLKS